MKKLMKKMSAAVATLMAAVIVVGCGTNGGGGGNYAQGITDDEILIASTFVTSGAWAFIGLPIVDAARAVIERANAHGGIGGRMINFMHLDDGGDPITGHILIESLLEEHRVFALLGISGAQAPVSLEYMLDFGVPILNITGGLASLYSEYNPGGMLFNIQPSNALDGPQMLARALATRVYGPNRDQYLADDAMIGLMINATDAGFDIESGVRALAEELGITDRLMIEFVTPDIYFTIIQQMMNAGVGVLLNGTLDSMGIVAAMSDAGWYVPVFGAYGTSTIASYSPATYHPHRPLFATIWAEDTSPAAVAMLADMRDSLNYLPHLDDFTRDGYVDNGFARAGYLMGRVMVIALERFVELDLDWTWENWVVAMEHAPFELGGTPPFSFAGGRRMGVEDLALWEYWVEIIDGEPVEQIGIIYDFATVEEILAPWRARTGN